MQYEQQRPPGKAERKTQELPDLEIGGLAGISKFCGGRRDFEDPTQRNGGSAERRNPKVGAVGPDTGGLAALCREAQPLQIVGQATDPKSPLTLTLSPQTGRFGVPARREGRGRIRHRWGAPQSLIASSLKTTLITTQ